MVMTPNTSPAPPSEENQGTPSPLADKTTCPWGRLQSVVTEDEGFTVRLRGLVNPASDTCCVTTGKLLNLSSSCLLICNLRLVTGIDLTELWGLNEVTMPCGTQTLSPYQIIVT